jgi:serine O-acetyltransferase
MLELLRAYKKFDPAAQSLLEIALLYPGVKAQAMHRIAHALYRQGIPVIPRMVSELSRWLTGIEIHPGARIGKNVIIEHGMGTVIGETAEVEDCVVILHGVTLGAKNIRDAARGKRHPTIKHGATLCAGVQVVGAITVGEGAMIGANSVVLSDVPANSVAAGVPARTRLRRVSTMRRAS